MILDEHVSIGHLNGRMSKRMINSPDNMVVRLIRLGNLAYAQFAVNLIKGRAFVCNYLKIRRAWFK